MHGNARKCTVSAGGRRGKCSGMFHRRRRRTCRNVPECSMGVAARCRECAGMFSDVRECAVETRTRKTNPFASCPSSCGGIIRRCPGINEQRTTDNQRRGVSRKVGKCQGAPDKAQNEPWSISELALTATCTGHSKGRFSTSRTPPLKVIVRRRLPSFNCSTNASVNTARVERCRRHGGRKSSRRPSPHDNYPWLRTGRAVSASGQAGFDNPRRRKV